MNPKKFSASILCLVFATGFFLLAPLLVQTASAKTLYVKRDGTKLRSAESAKSKVITKLRKGTSVRVLDKKKKFYKVSVSGKKGWIFQFKLTSKAPAGASQDGDFLGALGGKQQMAANESSSASSIRGLSPVSEKHARDKGIPVESIKAVKQMESFRINPEELDKFLSEGKLGEYSP